MVTLKNTGIEDLEQGEEIRNLQGAQSSITYQKATAVCYVKEENYFLGTFIVMRYCRRYCFGRKLYFP